MTVQRTNPPAGAVPRGRSLAEAIERLSRFEGSPQEFLQQLLALQCRAAGAEGGAFLRPAEEGLEALAVFPPVGDGGQAPEWIGPAAEACAEVLGTGSGAVRPLHGSADLYGQPARRHVLLLPLGDGEQTRGVAAYVVDSADAAELAAARERLELTLPLLNAYEARGALAQRSDDLAKLQRALETLSALNEHDRFAAAAMSLCNEVASRWKTERVSLGFLKGRYVALRAMSHTEKFSRKMKIVQDIEAAMEECLDQDVEVVYPAEEQAPCVSRAAGELSNRHGPMIVCSLPLRRAGKPIGVLTIERGLDQGLDTEDVESLRLACDLCTARLQNLYETDRWFGARAAAAARKGLAVLVGPKHTWLKLLAVGVTAFILFLAFVKGDYEAEASFVLEPVNQQVVAAPFEGKLLEVGTIELDGRTRPLEPGMPVQAGQVLAVFDTADLREDLQKALEQQQAYLAQARVAREEARTHPVKLGEAEVAEHQARAYAAEARRLELRIADARITAQVSGIIVEGDLKPHLRRAFQQGQTLFKIAQVDPASADGAGTALRAELSIPEDQVVDVRQRQAGELAANSAPDVRIPFLITYINPVAESFINPAGGEAADQKNVFKARAELRDPPSWLRPGMKGVAKVHIDRRPYGWLWTRKLVNWLRMKLWW